MNLKTGYNLHNIFVNTSKDTEITPYITYTGLVKMSGWYVNTILIIS